MISACSTFRIVFQSMSAELNFTICSEFCIVSLIEISKVTSNKLSVG